MVEQIQVKSEVKTEITDVTKTIQEKASKPKSSKKKIVLFVIFAIVSIVAVSLTIKFILNINWNTLFNSINNGFAQKIGVLWFLLLIFYLAFSIYNNIIYLWIRLKKLGYKIPISEWFLLGFTIMFFRAITPTIMSDSFIFVWLKTNNVPTYRVTNILFTNTLLWQIVQFTVTFPSFIMVLIYRNVLLYNSTGLANTTGVAIFAFLCAGVVIDALSTTFMYLLCVSKKVHYALSRLLNGIKKLLRMKYHTKEEVALKYKKNAIMKREFYESIKDIKTTLIIILCLALQEILTYLAIGWSMYFVQYVHHTHEGVSQIYKLDFNFGWAFNCANLAFTANRLNFFIPNGEGSLEFILQTFLVTYANITSQPIAPSVEITNKLIDDLANNSILIWRCFGAFIPTIIGIVTFIIWMVRKVGRVKKDGDLFHQALEPVRPTPTYLLLKPFVNSKKENEKEANEN